MSFVIVKENKKRILIICSWLELEGPVGIFFRNQAEIFSASFDIELLCFRNKNYKWVFRSRKIVSYSLIEQKSSLNIHFVDFFYHKILNKFGFKITYLLSKYLKNKFYEQNKIIDLIHVQSIFNASFFGYELSKLFGCKYLLTEHNQISFSSVDQNMFFRIKEILDSSSLNLVVSREKIKQFYANSLFFDYIPIGNMIDDSIFHYTPRSKKEGKIRIITVGAFHPIKGQDFFFKALELFPKNERHKYEICWVGYNVWNSNNQIEVDSFINKFDIEGFSITLIPSLKSSDLALHLSNSTLYVCPSICEGMSVAVLEALACGLPVVGTNCGGNDEIINSSNGILVPVFDCSNLFSAICQVLYNIDFYDSKEISEEIIRRFGRDKFFNTLNSYYLKYCR